jgi:hypothetical protein
MSWDIAISEHGDLVFAGNRDLEITEGVQLVNQRIINRIRLKRGMWIFNRDSSLGSDLDSIMGRPQEQQLENIPQLIADALAPMEDEIDIRDVQVASESRGVSALIEYALVFPDVPPDAITQNTVTLLIPVLGVSA